jgi:predicted 2-oxoglutarate/Fe(II)-dependent dioxygenase YbiX
LFPSYVLHKVKPITKGERWSLVTWVQDTKPFK